MSRSTPGAISVTIVTLIVLRGTPVAHAAAAAPELRPGAVEVGLAGSLTSIEGSTRSVLLLRAGSFRRAFSGLAGLEAEFGYTHDRALDGLDLEAGASWQHRAAASAVYPFAAIGGGLRQEKLGSFGQARYPVGFAMGARALFGTRAAVRIEYRYRRVLNDPVADFTEHQALTGISLFFRNQGEER